MLCIFNIVKGGKNSAYLLDYKGGIIFYRKGVVGGARWFLDGIRGTIFSIAHTDVGATMHSISKHMPFHVLIGCSQGKKSWAGF